MGNWFGPSTRIKLFVRELRTGRNYSFTVPDPNKVSRQAYDLQHWTCFYTRLSLLFLLSGSRMTCSVLSMSSSRKSKPESQTSLKTR